MNKKLKLDRETIRSLQNHAKFPARLQSPQWKDIEGGISTPLTPPIVYITMHPMGCEKTPLYTRMSTDVTEKLPEPNYPSRVPEQCIKVTVRRGDCQ